VEADNSLPNQALTRTIQASSFSKEFKAMATANKFKTLGDVVDYGVVGIPELAQGNYRLVVELLECLEENGLLELTDRIEEIDY
jgi:hypothetical protein